MNGSERLHQLDGLRGVAALVVLVFHYFAAVTPGETSDLDPGATQVGEVPLTAIVNGPFAVIVFFVLSGFVVSRSVANRADPLLLTIALRYVRLTVPALVSILVAFALLKLFPTTASDLREVNGADWLVHTHNGEIPPLGAAVKDGLVGMYRNGGSHFNNVLWTMRAELIGSVGIYLVYALVPARGRSLALLAAVPLIPLLGQPIFYVAFVLGALIQEAWSSQRLPRVAPWFLLGAGLLLGAPGEGFAERYGFEAWPASLQPGNKSGVIYPIAAALIVCGCLTSRTVIRVLRSAGCVFLGRISFGLYLAHVPLIVTVFAAAALSIWPLTPLDIVAGLVLVLALSLLAGWAFTVAVDEPVLRILSRLRRNVRSRLERSPGISST